MRNLRILTSASRAELAGLARASFMERTATWSVRIDTVGSRDDAQRALSEKADAFMVDSLYAADAFGLTAQANPAGELAGACDVVMGERGRLMGSELLPQAAIEALEASAFPINGARAVVLGASPFALALVYECARAGVEEVVLVGPESSRAHDALDVFLGTFSQLRATVSDMRQATEGHVSFRRAHDDTSFLFGSFTGCVKRVSRSDVIVVAHDGDLPVDFLSAIDFSAHPFVLDPLHGVRDSLMVSLAATAGCACVAGEACYGRWGDLAAQALVESTRAFG